MRRLILLLPMLLAAGSCPPRIEYVEVRLEIPADLLTPVPISDYRPETWRDVGKLATLHLESAQAANAKIEAIAEIVAQ